MTAARRCGLGAMRRPWPWVAMLAAAWLVLAPPSAHAGRGCELRPPQAWKVQRGLELALRTAQALDASGAQVALLARAGQDLSAYHLRWSHVGFVYRDGGQWRVVHKLNSCGAATAEIYRQGLGEFFLDDPHEFAAALAVFTPEVQARLLPLLRSNAGLARLHEPAYSMLAYPWAQTYQQSNQWVIETLALSQEPTAGSRPRAQAWLRFKGYEPTVLHIPALARLGARIGTANIAFDDHPNGKRFRDQIETVTADSVFDWLPRAGLAQVPQVLR